MARHCTKELWIPQQEGKLMERWKELQNVMVTNIVQCEGKEGELKCREEAIAISKGLSRVLIDSKRREGTGKPIRGKFEIPQPPTTSPKIDMAVEVRKTDVTIIEPREMLKRGEDATPVNSRYNIRQKIGFWRDQTKLIGWAVYGQRNRENMIYRNILKCIEEREKSELVFQGRYVRLKSGKRRRINSYKQYRYVLYRQKIYLGREELEIITVLYQLQIRIFHEGNSSNESNVTCVEQIGKPYGRVVDLLQKQGEWALLYAKENVDKNKDLKKWEEKGQRENLGRVSKSIERNQEGIEEGREAYIDVGLVTPSTIDLVQISSNSFKYRRDNDRRIGETEKSGTLEEYNEEIEEYKKSNWNIIIDKKEKENDSRRRRGDGSIEEKGVERGKNRGTYSQNRGGVESEVDLDGQLEDLVDRTMLDRWMEEVEKEEKEDYRGRRVDGSIKKGGVEGKEKNEGTYSQNKGGGESEVDSVGQSEDLVDKSMLDEWMRQVEEGLEIDRRQGESTKLPIHEEKGGERGKNRGAYSQNGGGVESEVDSDEQSEDLIDRTMLDKWMEKVEKEKEDYRRRRVDGSIEKGGVKEGKRIEAHIARTKGGVESEVDSDGQSEDLIDKSMLDKWMRQVEERLEIERRQGDSIKLPIYEDIGEHSESKNRKVGERKQGSEDQQEKREIEEVESIVTQGVSIGSSKKGLHIGERNIDSVAKQVVGRREGEIYLKGVGEEKGKGSEAYEDRETEWQLVDREKVEEESNQRETDRNRVERGERRIDREYNIETHREEIECIGSEKRKGEVVSDSESEDLVDRSMLESCIRQAEERGESGGSRNYNILEEGEEKQRGRKREIEVDSREMRDEEGEKGIGSRREGRLERHRLVRVDKKQLDRSIEEENNTKIIVEEKEEKIRYKTLQGDKTLRVSKGEGLGEEGSDSESIDLIDKDMLENCLRCTKERVRSGVVEKKGEIGLRRHFDILEKSEEKRRGRKKKTVIDMREMRDEIQERRMGSTREVGSDTHRLEDVDNMQLHRRVEQGDEDEVRQEERGWTYTNETNNNIEIEKERKSNSTTSSIATLFRDVRLEKEGKIIGEKRVTRRKVWLRWKGVVRGMVRRSVKKRKKIERLVEKEKEENRLVFDYTTRKLSVGEIQLLEKGEAFCVVDYKIDEDRNKVDIYNFQCRLRLHEVFRDPGDRENEEEAECTPERRPTNVGRGRGRNSIVQTGSRNTLATIDRRTGRGSRLATGRETVGRDSAMQSNRRRDSLGVERIGRGGRLLTGRDTGGRDSIMQSNRRRNSLGVEREEEGREKGRRLPSIYDPDSQNRNLNRYNKCIQEEIMLGMQKKVKFRDNISRVEREALKGLKNRIEAKEIIITRADKGSGLVAVDYDKYIAKGTKYIVEEAGAYTRVDEPEQEIIDKLRKERNKVAEILKEKGVISVMTATYIKKQLEDKITGIKFYYKIHKDTQIDTMPLRPLQSCIKAPMQHLSIVLTDLLQSLLTDKNIPSFIFDSNQLLYRLRKLGRIPDNCTLISSDVSALYPSIPHREGFRAMRDFLGEKTSYNRVQINSIIKALELVITDNYMTWNKVIYKQTSGVAMGTPVAVAYTNIFMNWVDRQVRQRAPYIYEHIRYIDDNLFILPADRVEELMGIANSILPPHIKFTYEKLDIDSDTGLAFLDTQLFISEDKVVESRLYTKKTDRHAYLLPASYHPPHITQNIPMAVFGRLRKICSKEEWFREDAKKAEGWLLNRGYAKKDIQKAVDKASLKDRWTMIEQIEDKRHNSTQKEEGGVVVIPFIITYNQHGGAIKKILKDRQPLLDTAFRRTRVRPRVSYRRRRNLNDIIVQRGLRGLLENSRKELNRFTQCAERPVYRTRCPCKGKHSHEKCRCCMHSKERIEGVDSRIHKPVNCNTKNIIYVIGCKECDKMYIGETQQRLKDRLAQHMYNVDKLNQPLYLHFRYVHKLENLFVGILETVKGSEPFMRKVREAWWINRLKTLEPSGFNIKLECNQVYESTN